MVAFYNQGDQDIYNQGVKFRPQQKYLLDDYTAPTAQIKPVPTSSGITNTNAFTNSGNDFSVYNPDPNSIVNKNYNPYPSRNAAENSYLPGRSNATDQVFNPKQLGGAQMPDELGVSTNTVPLGNNRISASQLGIGIPGGQVSNTYNRARNAMQARGDDAMSRDYPEFTAKEVARLTNNNIQDYRQNYGANTQYEKDNYYDTVDNPFAKTMNSQTRLDKFKDNYPEYYTKPEPTGLAKLAQFAGNLMPGAGTARLIGDYLPVNRRSILENELSGQNIMVNDIGQIVQGDGAYDTAANVMAGYNANKMTAETFDKRLAKIAETMGKKGYKGNLQKRVDAIEAAKADFLAAQGKTDLVFEDEEVKKKKKKKKGNIITKFLNKKKETKAADAATAAAERANRESTATIQDRVDRQYQDQMTRDNRDFSVSGPDTSANPRGRSNQASSEKGYQMHGADGGRAGYFFGGRVNFKDGGLASIL